MANLDELRLISRVTPRATDLSYGMNVAWMRLEGLNYSVGSFAHFFAVVCVVASAYLLIAGCNRNDDIEVGLGSCDSGSLDSFRVGASLYIGTFLLGNNWDYRLMFLIFCIPQLSAWLISSDERLRWCSRASLFSMFVSMWYLLIVGAWMVFTSMLSPWIKSDWPGPWLFDELSNWMLFLLLIYLFAGSLPSWAKGLLLHPLRLVRCSR